MKFRKYNRREQVPDTIWGQVETILVDSFPEEERRTMEEFQRLLCGSWLNLMTLEEGERVLGILLVWDLEGWVFLENFAVSRKARGGGLGSRMLEEVWNHWKKPVLLEVEPPEGEIERRRIGFYQRNGFHLSHYPYLMPNLHGGTEPLPLLLMSSPNPMTDQEAEQAANLLYDTAYREKVRPC